MKWLANEEIMLMNQVKWKHQKKKKWAKEFSLSVRKRSAAAGAPELPPPPPPSWERISKSGKKDTGSR